MEVDAPSEESIQAIPSTVTVHPSQSGSLVSVAEEAHPVKSTVGGVSSTGTVNPAAVFQFDSTMTSFDMDVDMSTAFISSFEMELYEPENSLNSRSEPRNSARRRRISFLKIAKSFWLRSRKMNRRLGSQSNVWIGSYGVLTQSLSHTRRFGLLLFQDLDGRAEARPQIPEFPKHRSGPFCVRTDGDPETFSGRFDAL